MIDAQLNVGYESKSRFMDDFSKLMEAPPANFDKQFNLLKACWLDTPLGPMLAIADENALYLLEFVGRRGLEREIERLQNRTKSAIVAGKTEPVHSIERELKAYFDGCLKVFQTPLHLLGSPFQNMAWEALLCIPYGETRSYAEQASAIGKPSAYRAVAGANGANQIAIVIPCHRIINSNGDLGGYGGGIAHKKWLLQHEARYKI